MIQTQAPQPFTEPAIAELAAAWVANQRDIASALQAGREGLRRFGLLGGFHTALSRFEAAIRADARAKALAEAATHLDGVAGTVEQIVTEHFGAASGIGPGSADMVREAANSVRTLAAAAGA